MAYTCTTHPQTYALESIFESWCQNVRTCQIMNKVNKEKEKRKHQSQETKTALSKIDVYGSFLEGKRHQSLAMPDKIKFFKEPKQTELAKDKHSVYTMHTIQHVCVTFDTTVATPRSNSSALLYFYKKIFHRTQHIMPFRNN